MTDDIPLPTLLSQLLIAFTIEFDNEAEHRLPHRTTRGGASGRGRGPWLVSQAMWANFMQFVGEDGVPLREIGDLAGLINLPGLERWGYITAGPDPADQLPMPPRRDWIVTPTRAGRRAQEVWEPLAGDIEGRWRDRFGPGAVTALRDALRVLTEWGVPVRDLPQLTGVSKEAISMAAGLLARRSYAVTGQDPVASRGKLISLTPRAWPRRATTSAC